MRPKFAIVDQLLNIPIILDPKLALLWIRITPVPLVQCNSIPDDCGTNDEFYLDSWPGVVFGLPHLQRNILATSSAYTFIAKLLCFGLR